MKKVFLLLAIFSALTASVTKAETVKSVTQISYDAAGRQSCVATRMNESTFLSLPTNACTHSAAGSQGADRIVKTVYDAAGQVRQVIQAYGTPIQRVYSTSAYSLNGKVTDSIDANGNRTRMEYDLFDRLSKIYYPSATAPGSYSPSTPDTALATAGGWNPNDFEQFGYDSNGNKTSFRRRNGYVINYTYDNLNQLLIEDIPVSPGNMNGVDKDIYHSYRYDGLLLKKRFAGFNGAGITYTYDGIGRMTSTTDSYGRQLISAYTVTGAPRTRLIYPDWKVWTQSYDATGLPISMADPQNQTVFGKSYNNFGQPTSLMRALGPITSYGYDPLKRLSSLAHDFNGTQDDINYGFTYNPAKQITSVSTSTDLYDYMEISNTTTNRSYDGLNRDVAIAAVNGGYDSNGNLAQEGTRFMVYDVHNRLISVASSSTAAPYMTLTYDTEGRLSKLYANVTTFFLYDGANLIAEYDHAGNMTRRYVHGSRRDEPVVWYEGGGIQDRRYFIQNYQGSVIATTDGVGNRAALYKYGPYGEPKNANNAESWAGSRFRYTGQTILAIAQLYYYKARIYDPKYGRFLQTDPVGSADQMNMYAYVGNDPVNSVDPTGMRTDNWEEDVYSNQPRDGDCGCQQLLGLVARAFIESMQRTQERALYAAAVVAVLSENIEDSEVTEAGGNTNPYTGPVDNPVIVVDGAGNGIPVGEGEEIKSSPDGEYQQVRGADGEPTGVRLDRGGHRTHKDPRARAPHAHQPGVTTPDGNRHLPIY